MDVSVIIVFRNEEPYLLDCVKSIENQFVGTSLEWELILVDGMSTDRSSELLTAYLEQTSYTSQIISNPQKTLAPGWNLGIKAAKAPVVIRPDAHSRLHPGYITIGLETLQKNKEITAVGGVLITQAKGFWGNVIRMALSSKTAVGASGFRTSTKSGFSDTAVYALYRKEIFEKAGYFDEELVRHQDNDMHKRIRDLGGKFFMNVEMKADYFSRNSIKKLLRQMFLIGYYLPDLLSRNALSKKYLAPFAFYFLLYLNLIFYLIDFPFFGFLFLAQLGVYLLLIALETIFKSISHRSLSAILNIFLIPAIHIFYALGTAAGYFRLLLKSKKS